MTWRKLFLWLFIISTVLLGTLWWHSTSTAHRVSYMPSGFGTGTNIAICSSTVLVDLVPDGILTTGLEYDSGPSSEIGIFTDSENDPRPGPFGRFSYFGLPMTEPATFSTTIHQLEFPFWVPWLLFVGVGFVFCRFMEKRSASGKEKRLADADAAGEA